MTWSIHGNTGPWGTVVGASQMLAWCTHQSIATQSLLPRAWRPWPTSTKLTWNVRGMPSWITWRASTNSSSNNSCSILTTAHTTHPHHPLPRMPAWGVHRSGLRVNRYHNKFNNSNSVLSLYPVWIYFFKVICKYYKRLPCEPFAYFWCRQPSI